MSVAEVSSNVAQQAVGGKSIKIRKINQNKKIEIKKSIKMYHSEQWGKNQSLLEKNTLIQTYFSSPYQILSSEDYKSQQKK